MPITLYVDEDYQENINFLSPVACRLSSNSPAVILVIGQVENDKTDLQYEGLRPRANGTK